MTVSFLSIVTRYTPQEGAASPFVYDPVPHARGILNTAIAVGVLAILAWRELRKCKCDDRKDSE